MNRELPNSEIATRKAEHIELALQDDAQFQRGTGLDCYEFVHEALPELALDEIVPRVDFLGRWLAAPLMVSGMTGGTERSAEINGRIAQAVADLGLGMGVGSQRISQEHPEVLSTFQVRRYGKIPLLLANLGAVQLNYGFTVDSCRRLVESIEADALALHLNPLQEAMQPGGNTDFRGLLRRITELCSSLTVPVIVKEVGCGISPSTVRRLEACGVAAVDVGGAGGTCWTAIEGSRCQSPQDQEIAATFRDWGIPTAQAVRSARTACPQLLIIASGGVRSGLDVAKCLALGANLAALAGPVLKAAVQSTEAVHDLLARLIRELRIAMFCTGSRAPAELRRSLVAAVGSRQSAIGEE